MNRRAGIMLLTLLALCLSPNSWAGGEVENIMKRVKSEYAPDTRVAVWGVSANEKNGVYELTGEFDNPNAKKALLKALDQENVKYEDRTVVLPSAKVGEKKWALVTISVACLRYDPRHAAEMASQAIMGTPLKVLDIKSGFVRVQTPDNYISYVTDSSVRLLSDAEFQAWKTAKRYVVTAHQTSLFENPERNENKVVSDLVLGNILKYEGQEGDFIKLSLPDGRIGYACGAEVAELSEWAKQDFSMEQIEKTARRMMGVPYLWGGTSVKSADCSGFVKTSYFSNAIILQRDASQQALTGEKVDWRKWQSDAEPGDLIFIGTKSGRVTHVAMYLEKGKYIHSSGRVKINSMNPSDKDYLDYTFLSMSRIKTAIGTNGIVAVRNHPWYF